VFLDENMKNVFILSQEDILFQGTWISINIYVLSSTISSHEIFSNFWMIDGKLGDLAMFF
jgi:hypothetical protein